MNMSEVRFVNPEDREMWLDLFEYMGGIFDQDCQDDPNLGIGTL